SDVCAAIYAPGEAQIKAPQLVKAFAQAAANSGATFYSQKEILGVARQDRRVTAVYTAQGESIACNHLVVASGAWSAGCGIWLDLPLPVNPQRGQILALRQPSPHPLEHVIFGDAVYPAPKKAVKIVVGAMKEE